MVQNGQPPHTEPDVDVVVDQRIVVRDVVRALVVGAIFSKGSKPRSAIACGGARTAPSSSRALGRHIDVMHNSVELPEWRISVPFGDAQGVKGMPVVEWPGHLKTGPPMRGSLILDAFNLGIISSAMWGEGDADFDFLYLTKPNSFHARYTISGWKMAPP